MIATARGRAGWLLLLLATLWPAGPLHAQDEAPVSLSVYEERLAAALAQLESGVDLEKVQADLAAIEQVRLPGGRVLDIVPLLDGIENVDDARVRLETVLAQLELVDSDRTADRLAALDRVSQRLDLDRPSLWERFTRWFGDLWDRLKPQRQSSGDAGASAGQAVSTVAGWGIIVVGSLLLVLLLSYWLRGFLGGILTDSAARARSAGSEGPATAAEAREQATAQAQRGAYRQAVRTLFLSALLHLRENGLLQQVENRTNREVLASLPPHSPARPHLEPVVETFDRVWYGIREPDEQTFNAYREEVNALMAETEEGSG
ncbi:MAG: DUF4129 domain-containing protein [Caldilineaceae bacterium]|nr:DUF4129 domain-containing protein [Caldilineaceae bacterium]